MRLRISVLLFLYITNFESSSALEFLTGNEITTTDNYDDITTPMWPTTTMDQFSTMDTDTTTVLDTTTIVNEMPTTTTPKVITSNTSKVSTATISNTILSTTTKATNTITPNTFTTTTLKATTKTTPKATTKSTKPPKPTRPNIVSLLSTTKKPSSIKVQTQDPVVTIDEGELKGSYKKNHYSFIGIRYGQSPEGERR